MKFKLLKDIRVDNPYQDKDWCKCGKKVVMKKGTIFVPLDEGEYKSTFAASWQEGKNVNNAHLFAGKLIHFKKDPKTYEQITN